MLYCPCHDDRAIGTVWLRLSLMTLKRPRDKVKTTSGWRAGSVRSGPMTTRGNDLHMTARRRRRRRVNGGKRELHSNHDPCHVGTQWWMWVGLVTNTPFVKKEIKERLDHYFLIYFCREEVLDHYFPRRGLIDRKGKGKGKGSSEEAKHKNKNKKRL